MMPAIQRILVAALVIFMTLFIINSIRRDRLIMRYALIWFSLSIILLFCVLMPRALDVIAGFFGFAITANMLFLIAFLTLTAICISLSMIVSRQQKMLVALVQEVSTLRMEIDKKNGKEGK